MKRSHLTLRRRHSESDEAFVAGEGPDMEDAVVWPEDDPSASSGPDLSGHGSTGALRHW